MITGAGGILAGEIIKQLENDPAIHIMALTFQRDALEKKYRHSDNISVYDADKHSEDFKINFLIHCSFSPYGNNGKELASSLSYTDRMVKWADKNEVEVFINISSRSVYGKSNPGPWKEEADICPDSPYAVSKYASELIVNNLPFMQVGRTSPCNIRLAGLTGPGMDMRITSRFVNTVINKKTIFITGGEQQFNFLYLSDAAEGIIQLLYMNKKLMKNLYNLGNSRVYTIIDLADTVRTFAEKYNFQADIEVKRDNTLLYDCMDSSLFYQDTEWDPGHDMESIIDNLFRHYLGIL